MSTWIRETACSLWWYAYRLPQALTWMRHLAHGEYGFVWRMFKWTLRKRVWSTTWVQVKWPRVFLRGMNPRDLPRGRT